VRADRGSWAADVDDEVDDELTAKRRDHVVEFVGDVVLVFIGVVTPNSVSGTPARRAISPAA
jgi:hypothetical protein